MDDSASKSIFGSLPASMQVGLWDNSQKLLASATVFNTDPLVGNFNYTTIAGTALAPGQTYTVAGLVSAGKSILSKVPDLATSSQVVYVGPKSLISSALTFPAGDQIGQPRGYFGPTFAYASAPAQLSITNYQVVSRNGSRTTYRADLVNPGPALAAVTATVSSLDPSLRVQAGQDTLKFTSVPATSQITSTGTFTVLGDSKSLPDTSKLQWTFTTTPTGAAAPVANAGPNKTSAVGSTVTLDGSGSSSSGTAALTYNWAFKSIPPGSAAFLSRSSTANPAFVIDVPGTYVITLTVSNGIASSSASVTVSSGSASPVANAGPNQSVTVGSTVILYGGWSQPSDGKPINYTWSLTSRPSGSAAVLSGSNTVAPAFVADRAGTYIAQLAVNDALTTSNAATVTITAGTVNDASDILLPANVAVARGQEAPFQVTLTSPAPAGGIFVTLLTSNPSKVTVSPSSVFIPEGATVSNQARLSGLSPGSATVSGFAVGLTPASQQVKVVP